ncbi:MAG: sulfatase-like hydrolase/transferase [Pseudomonadota bacterium]
MSKIENILLLSVEDLNDWISPLGGHPDAYTPDMARLAKRAFSFEAAYAASPACSPSRTATLFGQGPWRNGIYGNEQSWNMAYPKGKRLSIAGRAREAGWRTVMAGKVYHEGKSGQDPEDWDVMHPRRNEEFPPVSRAAKEGRFKPSDDFGPTDAERTSDDAFCDAMIAEMKPGATRQFWAHGIYRPHLPFIVPKRFFDLIPDPPRLPPAFGNRGFDAEDDGELLPLPRHAGNMSRRWTGRVLQETGEYYDFVRAYLASVAYADHLVGRLLDHLDETGLSASTLIVLWSDHGWQFGEKLAFRKFSLWERSLRVPLMVAGPGVAPGKTREPVSLLDIYPTLLEVIGGEAPHTLDGQNLWPVMGGEKGRGYAVSAFRVPNKKAPERARISTSVRNEEHRLIRYFDGTGELYRHLDDPFEKKTLVSGFAKLRDQELPRAARELMRLIPKAEPPKTEDDLPPHKRRWRGS